MCALIDNWRLFGESLVITERSKRGQLEVNSEMKCAGQS